MILKVTSSEARAKNLLYTKTYPLYIYMKGYYIPGFEPFLAILAFAFVAAVLNVRREELGRSLGRRLAK
ncbi:MAG: hypothetical protein GWN18_08895, partial [Thermoplasmata archaeon]|nr:hypothetical protein [Thermoplasmata archaeon]NIS12151.1 hypothetical protein [Thermoplasmata archaeon]NIS20074.1 hypothetical protein [Thermoplasmata archaeon]NIV78843.1 hypothetical protein [Thermoplasmata archaeon]NIW82672.1 hypothetical protein [Thermoplasmata archaeon]